MPNYYTGMEGLVTLVKSLTKGEVSLIKHLYRIKNSPENKKRDQLFHAIEQGLISTDEEGKKLFNDNQTPSAWSQLKSRLRNDILNAMLMSDSNGKYKTPYAQAAFDCKKAYLQGELLLGRGIYGEAMSILKKALKLAEKFELVPEMIMLDDLMRSHMIMKEGVMAFKDKSESIQKSIALLQKLENAKYHHYEITSPDMFQANARNMSNEYFRKKGKTLLGEIQRDYEETKSNRIGFYYHLTAMNFFSYLKKYEQALEHSNKLHELVDKSKVVSSKSNLAGVNMEIANIQINLGNYEQAVQKAQRSLTFFKGGMINELYALETLFYAHFRMKDMVSAGKVLKKALAHPQLEYNKSFADRWIFIQAGYEFQMGQHKKSLELIRKDKRLSKGKSEWMLGFCLLEFMNHLEMGNRKWVFDHFDYFRKQMKRLSNKEEESKDNRRCSSIVNIIKSFINNDGDYDKTVNEERRKIRLLKFAKKEYYWDPTGAEIIRFDEWLLRKAPIRSLEY